MLISPLIKPGTVSSTYYNHYSTLRTLEDLFLTGQSCTDTGLVAGSVCGGLDGQGHIGYAAQAGPRLLRPGCLHGHDVHDGGHSCRVHRGGRQRVAAPCTARWGQARPRR